MDLPKIASFADALAVPQVNREQAKPLVLQALQSAFEDSSVGDPYSQTCRYLSVLLRGDVDEHYFSSAVDLWCLHHCIQRGDDLVYLLDLPNTEAARAAALNTAEGNLFYAITEILDMAGVPE